MSKSRTLREILTAERLSAPIEWMEGQRQRPTADQVDEQKPAIQKRLYSWSVAHGSIETRRLVNRMRQCRPQQRCRIGGCCRCEARAQQTVVSWLVPAFSRIQSRGLQLAALTFVHDVGDVPHTQLNMNRVASGDVAAAKVRKAIRRALQDAGVTEYIFGLDVCLCHDIRANAPPYWNVHAHGILWQNDAENVARALSRRFSPTTRVSQPVVVKQLDGRLAAAAYIFKRLTDRKALLMRQTIPARATDRGNQRTRLLKLDMSDYAELIKFLSKLTLEGRLIVPGDALARPKKFKLFNSD